MPRTYKNPPNTKSAEFILTLGANEFRGFRGFCIILDEETKISTGKQPKQGGESA